MRRLAVLLFVACAHAEPRTSLGGEKVAIGVVTGDPDATQLVRDALALELTFAPGGLTMNVEAATGGHDEPARRPGDALASPTLQPPESLYRRVQHMVVTLHLVDAAGQVVAEGTYEDEERGAERPRDSRANDDLGVILARRIVRRFLAEHGY